MRSVAVANQKGGCGKTTTTVNLGACLGVLGHRVLLVDLDPQSHATIALSDPAELDRPGAAAVLTGQIAAQTAVRPVARGVDLLGSSRELDALERRWDANRTVPSRLENALAGVAPSYDYLLIDCPPNTGPLTRTALGACDFLLLPVETSYFALFGVGRMLRLVEEEESRRGRVLPYAVLLTMFDRRTAHAREMLEQLRDHFGTNLLDTVITVNVSLREAASHGRPITDYRPRSQGCQRYTELATELHRILLPQVAARGAVASGGEGWTS